MIGKDDPYRASHACCILDGDHVQVSNGDGTIGVRWLLPGVYDAGEVIPELIIPGRSTHEF